MALETQLPPFDHDIKSLFPAGLPRCHLPNSPVTYPADCSASAQVTTSKESVLVPGICRSRRYLDSPLGLVPTLYPIQSTALFHIVSIYLGSICEIYLFVVC